MTCVLLTTSVLSWEGLQLAGVEGSFLGWFKIFYDRSTLPTHPSSSDLNDTLSKNHTENNISYKGSGRGSNNTEIESRESRLSPEVAKTGI